MYIYFLHRYSTGRDEWEVGNGRHISEMNDAGWDEEMDEQDLTWRRGPGPGRSWSWALDAGTRMFDSTSMTRGSAGSNQGTGKRSGGIGRMRGASM